MLDLMRKHAKSWVINVIIAAIAIVFVFWGAGSFRNQAPAKVATVNGEPISMAQYQETYRRLLEATQNQFKGFLNDELLQAMNLKQRALDSLIEERLLVQQAALMGVKVVEEDLQAEIAQTPLFQVDGRFNKSQYVTMLSRFGYTPADYEDLVRRGQLSRKVIGLIAGSAKVSEAEVADYYHFSRDQADLEFVLFKAESYRDQVKPTEEDIKNYYEKNKEQYRIPAKVQVDYMVFRPGDFEADVKVADDEIADYYELNLDKYDRPEQAKARHILFKVPAEATPEQDQTAKAMAEDVLKKAREDGADFAQLAKLYSEGPTAEKGGDLGWFTREQMVKEFADAAFAAKPGEVVGPVKTQFGYHVIKVEEHKEAGRLPLEEVKEQIKKQLVAEKAALASVDRAEQVYEEIGLSHDFEGVAKNMNLSVIRTGFFSLEDVNTEMGLDDKFNQMALSLKKGEISTLVEGKNGYYILKAVDRQESYIPELAEVTGAVGENVAQEQALEMAGQAAEAFLVKAGQEGGWGQAVQEAGLEVLDTGPFTRSGQVPKIGMNQQLVEDVFTLKPGGLGKSAYQGTSGYYAVRLKEQIPATEEDFAKQKESLTESLKQNKGKEYIDQWLEAVKAKAEIEIEPGVI